MSQKKFRNIDIVMDGEVVGTLFTDKILDITPTEAYAGGMTLVTFDDRKHKQPGLPAQTNGLAGWLNVQVFVGRNAANDVEAAAVEAAGARKQTGKRKAAAEAQAQQDAKAKENMRLGAEIYREAQADALQQSALLARFKAAAEAPKQ